MGDSSGSTCAGGGSQALMRDFPPFYTLQRVHSTRLKQLQAWASLVTQHCAEHRILCLHCTGAEEPLFANHSIQRRASPALIHAIFEWMVEHDKAVWKSSGKSAYILWRPLEDWAQMVLQWAMDTGNVENVLTIFEVLEGDATRNQEFHGLPEDFFLHILRHLQAMGKANLFGCESEQDVPTGVKFFA